jgi:hypothetical protein
VTATGPPTGSMEDSRLPRWDAWEEDSDGHRPLPRGPDLTLVTRLALRAAGARRVEAGAELRLRSLAAGLSADIAAPAPELWLAARPEQNALVAGREHPILAVTRSLLVSFSRTELEAVVAHCLVRFALGESARALRALALGPWGRPPEVGYADDVAAVALTRYPPALVRSLRSAQPVGGRYGPLWFVAQGRFHRPVPERIAALQDL